MKKRDIILGLAVALLLAVFSFLASSSPDGLERVAKDRGFIESAVSMIRAPIPDYLAPGVANERMAGSLAGITGVLVVFVLGIGLGILIKKTK